MERDLASVRGEWRTRAKDFEWRRIVETALKRDRGRKKKGRQKSKPCIGASFTPDFSEKEENNKN